MVYTEWIKQFGTLESDYSSGVATDNDGNVYISGLTRGILDGTSSAGSNDAWLAKIVQSNTRKIDDLENLQPISPGSFLHIDARGTNALLQDKINRAIKILNQGLQINGNAGRAIKVRISWAIALLENEID